MSSRIVVTLYLRHHGDRGFPVLTRVFRGSTAALEATGPISHHIRLEGPRGERHIVSRETSWTWCDNNPYPLPNDFGGQGLAPTPSLPASCTGGRGQLTPGMGRG